MLARFFLILLMSGPFLGMAQASLTLTGQLKNLPGQTVYLLSYYGERNSLVDSVKTDADGRFTLALRPQMKPGLFKLAWGKDNSLDLVLNRENVVFETDANAPVDSMHIRSSVENRIYYDYMNLDRFNQSRLELLLPVVDYYPVKDDFYRMAAAQYDGIQKQQEAAMDSLDRLFPSSWAVRICKVYRTPYLPSTMGRDERMDYLKQHYFDPVDFRDTALLRTNAFANKAISYLSLYSNNRLTQKQLELEFIKAVTVIMSAASVSPESYKFLLDYLVGGFDKYHFEDVITYMAENFQDPFSCEDKDKKSALQKKLDTFKQIAIGKPAPELDVPDAKGNMFKLSDLSSPYTLLVFWSSQCSHCADMMPKLKALYDSQKPKKMEVVAVSIDTDRKAWTDFIKAQKLTWINVSELKGFDCKSTDDYNIYATPTMFLLDRDKKIIAKPVSYRELEQVLQENHVM